MKGLWTAVALFAYCVNPAAAVGTSEPDPVEEVRIPTLLHVCKFQVYANEAYRLVWSQNREYAEGYLAELARQDMCYEWWGLVPEDWVVICLAQDWRCSSIEIEGGYFGILLPPYAIERGDVQK